uniref:Uncharacterized protein n=1 Tax=Anguilla anguilla TaxID=7936 RepID=A0A0E9XP33_ANGAN
MNLSERPLLVKLIDSMHIVRGKFCTCAVFLGWESASSVDR